MHTKHILFLNKVNLCFRIGRKYKEGKEKENIKIR